MKVRAFFLASLLTFVALAANSWAQMKVRINWTAVTGAQSGAFVAQEEGLFKKNGLEVELIHIPSSSRGIQAILAGELAFSYMDGLNEAQANLKGAGLALVAGATNRFVFSLMSRPEIKRISDLRGKKIGITRVGSSTHTAALYALGQGGLKPSDYQILPLVEVPNILTALMAGQIDAGVVSPPTNSRARKAGFNELANLAKDGPEYVSVAIGTTRSYIKANEDIVRRVVRSYAEAVALFKTNKAVGTRVLQKYTRVKDPDILEDGYNQFRDYLESIPYVSRKGIEAILSELGEKEAAARQAKPEDFIDMRFVAELERDGFFKKLWGK
ncbi:ABC transporter substrate-binding protein [bacterium]|nr:MAG: ABC transporter substrate-binding protein [bacterium]